MKGDLLKDNSSSVGESPSLEIMGYFPLLRTIGCYLVHLFQIRGFFLPGTTADYSHVASVQHELVTSASVSPAPPASVLPAPPASSPSPKANGGTNPQVLDALDCSTLRLLQVDRIRKGESKEFQVTGGC